MTSVEFGIEARQDLTHPADPYRTTTAVDREEESFISRTDSSLAESGAIDAPTSGDGPFRGTATLAGDRSGSGWRSIGSC